MGFYIRECQSMNYKNRFQPCEILQTRSSDDEEPVWVRQEPAAGETEATTHP
jgi:arginine-tRNA-protein transferase